MITCGPDVVLLFPPVNMTRGDAFDMQIKLIYIIDIDYFRRRRPYTDTTST